MASGHHLLSRFRPYGVAGARRCTAERVSCRAVCTQLRPHVRYRSEMLHVSAAKDLRSPDWADVPIAALPEEMWGTASRRHVEKIPPARGAECAAAAVQSGTGGERSYASRIGKQRRAFGAGALVAPAGRRRAHAIAA